MPRVIWKFPVPLNDTPLIKMPPGARILSVGAQGEVITLWAEVDPYEGPPILRKFHIRGTGHPVPEGEVTFIGTVLMSPFVWHVYDGGESGMSLN